MFDQCRVIAETNGEESKYFKDCLVRSILEMEEEDFRLWWDRVPVAVVAGIGTLVIDRGGQRIFSSYSPNGITPHPPVQRMAASSEAVSERRRVCATCSYWSQEACTAPGCRCAGTGSIVHALSKCPIGKWPACMPRALLDRA